MTFHLTCVHIVLVRFRLLSGHLLGNSCSFDKPYVFSSSVTICISVLSRFGFEGWIWVLIASVPDLCIVYCFHFEFTDIVSVYGLQLMCLKR